MTKESLILTDMETLTQDSEWKPYGTIYLMRHRESEVENFWTDFHVSKHEVSVFLGTLEIYASKTAE